MVEVTGLEPAASCSQSKRATNCATPRCKMLLRIYVYPTIMLWSPSCGARNAPARCSLRRISTAAPKSPSLHPPQAAVGLFAQSKRATHPSLSLGRMGTAHSRGAVTQGRIIATCETAPRHTSMLLHCTTLSAQSQGEAVAKTTLAIVVAACYNSGIGFQRKE